MNTFINKQVLVRRLDAFKQRKVLKVSACIASVVLVLSAASQSWALGQHDKDHHDRRGHRGDMHFWVMEKALDLTPEQLTQIEVIKQEAKMKREARKAEFEQRMTLSSLDPASPDYIAQVNQLIDVRTQKVRERMLHKAELVQSVYAILDDEQKVEFKELLQQFEKRKKRHH